MSTVCDNARGTVGISARYARYLMKGRALMTNTFTAIFQQDGDWWTGYVEELPGANTQGATLDEARENLREAVALILEANRDLARQQSAGKPIIRETLSVAG